MMTFEEFRIGHLDRHLNVGDAAHMRAAYWMARAYLSLADDIAQMDAAMKFCSAAHRKFLDMGGGEL